jgi:hypothetical protein
LMREWAQWPTNVSPCASLWLATPPSACHAICCWLRQERASVQFGGGGHVGISSGEHASLTVIKQYFLGGALQLFFALLLGMGASVWWLMVCQLPFVVVCVRAVVCGLWFWRVGSIGGAGTFKLPGSWHGIWRRACTQLVLILAWSLLVCPIPCGWMLVWSRCSSLGKGGLKVVR